MRQGKVTLSRDASERFDLFRLKETEAPDICLGSRDRSVARYHARGLGGLPLGAAMVRPYKGSVGGG